MIISKFKHNRISKDGTAKPGGAVITKGGIILVEGSCNLKNCHCSDGYYLSVVIPLKNGIVEGIQIEFKDYEEMKNNLKLNDKNNDN